MARLTRFYCPKIPPQVGETAILDGDEAQHACNVLRLGPGDRVTLFDGGGGAVDAEIVEAGKRQATLRIIEVHDKQPDPPVKLTIAVAPPKKDFDDLVVRLAELRVSKVTPLATRYGEVDLTRRDRDRFSKRMQRLAIRAAKQSGNNHLIQVAEQTTIESLQGDVIVCQMGGQSTLVSSLEPPPVLTLAVGPEGGWSEDERTLFTSRGWPLAALPGGVLRTATAAVAAAAIALAFASGKG